MKTFSIHTLGCKVNQYESEQIAQVFRDRGLRQVDTGGDVRIVNTCSVTVQAAAKSRYEARRSVRLNVLTPAGGATSPPEAGGKTIVTGCWATSDTAQARAIEGVDAVITHHEDVQARISQLLDQWLDQAGESTVQSLACGTTGLPILHDRQSGHQRAFLKIQDGCDAHCTYCIIPQLRPKVWSKSIDDAVDEARRLTEAGHQELILTGIFLGAYGHDTALRRRQGGDQKPIASLIDALCTRVPSLRRLRLSSLEPGDLDDRLLATLKSHRQVVPHFHLPLQSGSDAILRKMNRQYTRDDFLRLIEQMEKSFDRPALTTDVIVGFPGESQEAFEQTLDVCRRARFIHIHAFPFSPRPKTAAARWRGQFVQNSIANQRVEMLTQLAQEFSVDFRRQFVGQTVELLVERQPDGSTRRHGRCPRYFDVQFESGQVQTGQLVDVRITQVDERHTIGEWIQSEAVASL